MNFIKQLYLVCSVIIILLLASKCGFAQNITDDYDVDSRHNIKCGTFQNIQKFKKFKDQLLVRDSLGDHIFEASYLSPSHHFLIHFDTTGSEAVSTVDNNRNGIPDYIDSVAYYFEYAYKVEVDSMGYRSPIIHNTGTEYDAYQVYILDIGNSDQAYYGMTNPDVQPVGNFERSTSYIIIDNNFSPLDSTYNDLGNKIRSYYTFGIDAMKITAAHEFHHAIQYMYGMDLNALTLAEMSSTFMEYRLHPDVKDYYQFVNSLFRHIDRYTFSLNDGQVGYRYGIFGQYLFKYYADSALKRMWEIDGKDVPTYIALDSCLKERGSSLADSWHEFQAWLYYTGTRTIPGKYFNNASEFPMMRFFDSIRFSYPSITRSGSLYPFEIHPMLLYLPKTGSNSGQDDDAVAAFLTNTELSGKIIGIDTLLPYNFVVSSAMISGGKEIGNTQYYSRSDNPYGFIFDTLFINSILEPTFAFPDPYNPGTDPELYLPSPDNIKAGSTDKVSISIYNTEMLQLFSDNVSPIVVNVSNSGSYKVLPLTSSSIPSSFTNGIYIYRVKYGDSESYGKFAVRR
jgi:hypothetical protein